MSRYEYIKTYVERIISLLSCAVRIEPGLIRDIRRIVAYDIADPGIEADIWCHPVMKGRLLGGATMDPTIAVDIREKLGNEPGVVMRQLLAKIREWHKQLPEEVWHEEVMNVPLSSRKYLPDSSDIFVARNYFREFCKRFSHSDENDAIWMKRWFKRFRSRAGRNIWYDRIIGKEIRSLDREVNGGVDGYVPPYEARIFGDDGKIKDIQLCIWQRGAHVIIGAANSDEGIAKHVDDLHLGDVLSSGGRFAVIKNISVRDRAGKANVKDVDIKDTFKMSSEEVDNVVYCNIGEVQDSVGVPVDERFDYQIITDYDCLDIATCEKPEWASRIGIDRIGLWADLTISNRTGQEIAQRLRWVQPGRIPRGREAVDGQRRGANSNEIIHRGIWVFETLCTRKMWLTVKGNGTDGIKDLEQPVGNVSYSDVRSFLSALNGKLIGGIVELPEIRELYNAITKHRLDEARAHGKGINKRERRIKREWCRDNVAGSTYESWCRQGPVQPGWHGILHRAVCDIENVLMVGIKAYDTEAFVEEQKSPDIGFRCIISDARAPRLDH